MNSIIRFLAPRTCGLFILSSPRIVGADGGIASLGALLPVYLALAGLSVALLTWLILSLILYLTKPARITRKKIRFYHRFSILVLVLVLAVGSLTALFAGILAFLIFIVFLLVWATTYACATRARDQMPTDPVDDGRAPD